MEATHRLPAPSSKEGELVGSQDGAGLRIGLLVARFNEEITKRLLEGAYEALERLRVREADRRVAWVPGAFELPLAAAALARSGRVDAVACLGCVIRGETTHDLYVGGECARGLQQVQLETGVPVAFGVLTTGSFDQALERSGGSHGNKGYEAVLTAVEMANLLREL